MPRAHRDRYTRGVRVRPIDLVDVLVYLVVLGVFIQLFPAVISETFLLALLTAVLLKVVLEIVVWAKKRLISRIRGTKRSLARAVSVLTLVVLLPGSKLLVLAAVDLIFGDAVYLGGFFSVTLLIIVLMLARGLVRRLFTTQAAGLSEVPSQRARQAKHSRNTAPTRL